MSLAANIQTLLDSLFKPVPRLPAIGRRSVAQMWPAMAIIVAFAQGLAVAGLWQLSRSMHEISRHAIIFSDLLDGPLPVASPSDYALVYAGMGLAGLSAVLLFAAVPGLRKKTPGAWTMVAVAILLNIAYGIVMLFIEGRGTYGFMIALAGSLAGLYLLQQAKDWYVKKPKRQKVKTRTR